MKKNIGWIGTGVMGRSMCSHLIDNGCQASIYNRTKDKAQDLIDKGAVWCDSPAQVAEKSEVIFTIVGFPEDVEEVILGKSGALSTAPTGSIIVDMTTSKPSLAKEINLKAKDKNIMTLDAPVSGGDTGAREGKLAIMAGGDKEAFDEVLPHFQIMGENISYLGPSGSGQDTKMCNQILIAGTIIGVVESLLYAYKNGLDPDQVIDVIGKGAASSWSINNLGRRIVKQNFEPGFYIKHFIKDMGIALDEAKRMNLALPGLAMVYQFYQAASAMGMENLGTQGLFKVLQMMNNVKC